MIDDIRHFEATFGAYARLFAEAAKTGMPQRKRERRKQRDIMKKAEREKKSPEQARSLDSNIGFLLRKAYQRNMLVFQEHAPHPSLTSVQAAALMALDEHSPCSFAELGRTVAMDPATTRGVVGRMRERNLVRTEPGLIDKREVIIHLEKEGKRLATALVPIGKKISEETMAGFSSGEKVALEFLLKKICGE